MKFKLATYNVWFGDDGKGEPYPKERMKAIGEIVQAQNETDCLLAVCGFQEVTQQLGDTLQSSLPEYTFLRQSGAYYGCALAIHEKLSILQHGWIPFSDSSMCRGFLHVRARLPNSNQEILFTTTHLESPLDEQGISNAQERVGQIREMEAFCNIQSQNHKHLKLAVIAGDLNWHENTGRDVPLLEQGLQTMDWKDAWLETSSGADDGGYTYDCIANPFRDGDRQERLDRILHRSMSNTFTPMEATLVGNTALPDLTIRKHVVEQVDAFTTPVKAIRHVPIVPSDHFGLVTTFEEVDSTTSGKPLADLR